MDASLLLVYLGTFFGVAILGAIILYVLGIFYTHGGSTTTMIFRNTTGAANWTRAMQQSIMNISSQLPNAGTLIGVAVLIGVIGLMGIGGFAAYRKAKGYM